MVIDKDQRFLFSPLQSEFAHKHLPESYTQDLNTVVVLIDGKVFIKSEGVLNALNRIGGGWKLATVFKIIPIFFRDSIYNFVATNRYKIFGKKETCRLPTPEERQRFIT
jgi:predicted DCC family thiol-disulfide oxidoreductase YuxK